MEFILAKSVIISLLTLLMIITGVLLKKDGKPYKAGIFALHKIAVVSTSVLVVMIYIQHLKIISFQGIGLILFILSDILFLISFVTGALLSFEKLSSFRLQFMHRVLSWLTILFIPIIWLVCH